MRAGQNDKPKAAGSTSVTSCCRLGGSCVRAFSAPPRGCQHSPAGRGGEGERTTSKIPHLILPARLIELALQRIKYATRRGIGEHAFHGSWEASRQEGGEMR